jgi:hypothetical protein
MELSQFSQSPYIAVVTELSDLLLNFQGCHTRYYHNYSVSEAENPDAQCQYYAVEVPTYIHVFEPCYVKQELCHYFGCQLCPNQ